MKLKLRDITFWFKILYLILTLLTFNSFTAHTKFLLIFATAVSCFGIIILIWRMLHYNEFKQIYALPILLLFEVSYVISMIVNYRYGVWDNIKALLWMTLQIGILFAVDYHRAEIDIKMEASILVAVFQVYTFIANIISLYYLFTHIGYASFQSPTKNMLGFIWGRLWGIYTDPNYASVGCTVSILISLYCIMHFGGVIFKIANYLQIVFALLYISFSDSRTGLVCFIVGILGYSIYFLNQYLKKKRKHGNSRAVIALSLSALIVIVGALLLQGVKNFYNVSQIQISDSQIVSQEEKQNSAPTVSSEIKNEEIQDKEIGRSQDIENDISNRRFSIWKSGLEIWKKSPVVGTSFRNITSFAKEKVPSTYLVKNDLGVFESFHNALIDVLVSQGAIGIIIMLIFIYKIIKLALLNQKCFTEHNDFLFLMFLIVFVYCISGLFLSDVVYINSSGAFITWCFMGYLVFFLTSHNFKQSGGDQCRK